MFGNYLCCSLFESLGVANDSQSLACLSLNYPTSNYFFPFCYLYQLSDNICKKETVKLEIWLDAEGLESTSPRLKRRLTTAGRRC